jgi:hypothetical protein
MEFLGAYCFLPLFGLVLHTIAKKPLRFMARNRTTILKKEERKKKFAASQALLNAQSGLYFSIHLLLLLLFGTVFRYGFKIERIGI